MLHIALCDDNPASIEILEKYFDILNDSTIDYDVYFSAEELYRYKLNNELTYDIYILDIEMQGMNGLELAKTIRTNEPNALIIFLTSYSELLKDNLITKQNQDLYLYGLNGFILLFVNLLTSLLLGYFTNHLLEIIMFLILFIPLRSNAGGFHTKKKLTCYCFSNLMLLAIVYIPNLIISKTAYGIIAILFVLSNLLILCLAPIPNFNRIFDPSEKIVFKRRTHYVLLIEFCFVIFTSFFNFDYWSKLYMLVPIVVAFLLIIGFLTNKMRHLF